MQYAIYNIIPTAKRQKMRCSCHIPKGMLAAMHRILLKQIT